MIKALLFDWGNTLMKEYPEYTGPMAYWPVVELMTNVYLSLESVSKTLLCCAVSNASDSNGELIGRYHLFDRELSNNSTDVRGT